MRRLTAFVIVLLVVYPSLSVARGKAVLISHGRNGSDGVVAAARGYKPSNTNRVADQSPLLVDGVGTGQGPVLIPLAAMVNCGHDPRWAGGVTCALQPPEPVVAGKRIRKDRDSPEQVAKRFMDRAIALAPKPRLRITPGRRGLVGLESYFFLAQRPRPIRARANVGGFVVTAEARPIQYVWTYGDGSDTVTRHHGRRWTKKRPGNIDHVYETKRRYRVRVEVIWRARWRIGLGPWRTLGYFRNRDFARYRVGELVPVLVKSS